MWGRGGMGPRAERERLILVASCAGTRPVTVAVTAAITRRSRDGQVVVTVRSRGGHGDGHLAATVAVGW